MPWEIDIVSQQSAHPVNTDLLHTAVAVVLQQEQLISAILSISIVDNAAIHRINRQYLQHDYPTDVISFQLGFDDAELPPQDSDEQDETDSDGALTVAAPETPLAAGAAIEGEIIASGTKWLCKWPRQATGRQMLSWHCTLFTDCCTCVAMMT